MNHDIPGAAAWSAPIRRGRSITLTAMAARSRFSARRCAVTTISSSVPLVVCCASSTDMLAAAATQANTRSPHARDARVMIAISPPF